MKPPKARRGRKLGSGDLNVQIRLRISQAYKDRLDVIVERRPMQDRSEVLREALAKFVEAEEERLGLSALDRRELKPSPQDDLARKHLEEVRAKASREAKALFKSDG